MRGDLPIIAVLLAHDADPHHLDRSHDAKPQAGPSPTTGPKPTGNRHRTNNEARDRADAAHRRSIDGRAMGTRPDG